MPTTPPGSSAPAPAPAVRPGPLRFRSLLFVPGHRPDMVAKLPRWRPDAAVVDLEDAVPEAGKDAARRAAVGAIRDLDLQGGTVLLRVNPVGTAWFADDVAAAVEAGADGVVVPKYDRVDQLDEVRALLERAGAGAGTVVVVGLETVLAVADARLLLAAGAAGADGADRADGAGGAVRIAAAYFGAEDYVADLGGRRTTGGAEVLHPRSEVAIAGRLAGVPVIDQAVVDIGDGDRFATDAAAGRDLGYAGKICVHPAQVALSHDAFGPTPAEVDHARAVLAAAAGGVASLDGRMIDEVHVRMARAVLAGAGAAPHAGSPPDPAWTPPPAGTPSAPGPA